MYSVCQLLMEPVLYMRCFFYINVTYTISVARIWLLKDSATTLLPTKFHGSDKGGRHGRQQMINFDKCRYENNCLKLCFNFNVVVVSDAEKTKWKTIIMPMYNYTCTLCKISTIVHYYDLHLREYQLIYIIRTWTSS